MYARTPIGHHIACIYGVEKRPLSAAWWAWHNSKGQFIGLAPIHQGLRPR